MRFSEYFNFKELSSSAEIIFKKEVLGKISAVTVLSQKKKAITLKSAWITKEKQHISPPSDVQAPNQTPYSELSMNAVSNNRISQTEEKSTPSGKKSSDKIHRSKKAIKSLSECLIPKEVRFSTEFMTKENTPAPFSLIKKKINGTYYCVIAVTDSSWKKLWVSSAFINKKSELSEVLNDEISSLSYTPEAVHPASSLNNSIPQTEEKSTPSGEKSSDKIHRSKKAIKSLSECLIPKEVRF